MDVLINSMKWGGTLSQCIQMLWPRHSICIRLYTLNILPFCQLYLKKERKKERYCWDQPSPHFMYEETKAQRRQGKLGLTTQTLNSWSRVTSPAQFDVHFSVYMKFLQQSIHESKSRCIMLSQGTFLGLHLTYIHSPFCVKHVAFFSWAEKYYNFS